MKRALTAALAFGGAALLLLVVACSSSDVAPQPEPTPVAIATPSAIPTATPAPVAARATRMVIESIGVDAPVSRLYFDPEKWAWSEYGPEEVAWFDGTGPVGSGLNALFWGHVDWIDRPRAVFWRLRDVQTGDLVRIWLEDGTEAVYKVTDTYFVETSDPQLQELEKPVEGDTITLETCGGDFIRDASNPVGGAYTHRRVVRAERVLQPLTAVSQPSQEALTAP